MAEAKTVQQRVRPITVRCASAGCSAKAEAAAMFAGEGDECEVIAPRGWIFGARDPRSTGDVVYGTCPEHSKK